MIKIDEVTICDPASGIEYEFSPAVGKDEAALTVSSIHAPVDKGHPWVYHGEAAEKLWMALNTYQVLK